MLTAHLDMMARHTTAQTLVLSAAIASLAAPACYEMHGRAPGAAPSPGPTPELADASAPSGDAAVAAPCDEGCVRSHARIRVREVRVDPAPSGEFDAVVMLIEPTPDGEGLHIVLDACADRPSLVPCPREFIVEGVGADVASTFPRDWTWTWEWSVHVVFAEQMFSLIASPSPDLPCGCVGCCGLAPVLVAYDGSFDGAPRAPELAVIEQGTLACAGREGGTSVRWNLRVLGPEDVASVEIDETETALVPGTTMWMHNARSSQPYCGGDDPLMTFAWVAYRLSTAMKDGARDPTGR